jgi:hypothetical protein
MPLRPLAITVAVLALAAGGSAAAPPDQAAQTAPRRADPLLFPREGADVPVGSTLQVVLDTAAIPAETVHIGHPCGPRGQSRTVEIDRGVEQMTVEFQAPDAPAWCDVDVSYVDPVTGEEQEWFHEYVALARREVPDLEVQPVRTSASSQLRTILPPLSPPVLWVGRESTGVVVSGSVRVDDPSQVVAWGQIDLVMPDGEVPAYTFISAGDGDPTLWSGSDWSSWKRELLASPRVEGLWHSRLRLWDGDGYVLHEQQVPFQVRHARSLTRPRVLSIRARDLDLEKGRKLILQKVTVIVDDPDHVLSDGGVALTIDVKRKIPQRLRRTCNPDGRFHFVYFDAFPRGDRVKLVFEDTVCNIPGPQSITALDMGYDGPFREVEKTYGSFLDPAGVTGRFVVRR